MKTRLVSETSLFRRARPQVPTRALTMATAVVLALFGAICPSAQATYIATLDQVGADVVGTGSGSIDFTDLTFINSLPNGFPNVEASIGQLRLGSPFSTVSQYSGISGPTSFGSGSIFFADSGSGNLVGVAGGAPGGGRITVPTGYIPGTPLGISTATWNNDTFASLGLTPGTYTWTWGTGIHADSFTLNIGQSTPTNGVPESGNTALLMLGAIGALIAFRSKFATKTSS